MNRADYTHSIDGDLLYLKDLDYGNKSLTNNMEKVLKEVSARHRINLTNFKIIYCDSMGNWDGVRWRGQDSDVEFIPLNTNDFETAKTRIYAHKHS